MKSSFFYQLCFNAGRGGFVHGQFFCPVRDKLICSLSSNLSIDVSSIRSRALGFLKEGVMYVLWSAR